MIDRFTNYRSRYGYPTRHAIAAEIWWRLEHAPLPAGLRARAYARRKGAEHRGSSLCR